MHVKTYNSSCNINTILSDCKNKKLNLVIVNDYLIKLCKKGKYYVFYTKYFQIDVTIFINKKKLYDYMYFFKRLLLNETNTYIKKYLNKLCRNISIYYDCEDTNIIYIFTIFITRKYASIKYLFKTYTRRHSSAINNICIIKNFNCRECYKCINYL